MPIDDLFREQSCESQLVCMCIAEEPVVRILGEIFLEASSFLLHIHAPVAEHVAQDIGEQLHESDSLFLFTAALFQERTDLEITNKSCNGIRNFLLIIRYRWYNRHGATPLMV